MNKLKTAARVTEVDTASEAVFRLSKDYDWKGENYFNQKITEIEAKSGELTSAIKGEKNLSGLDKADGERDVAINDLFTILKGYSVFPNEKIKEAALVLLSITEKYKGITRENYESQSSNTNSMLEDFSSEKVKDALESLPGVKEQLLLIKTAQDNFVKANDEYFAGKSSKARSASDIKKEILSLINDDLVPYLNVMATTNGEKYGDYCKKLSEQIDNVNAKIVLRAKTEK